MNLTTKNSLPPVLKNLKKEGYTLVGLEQTTHSSRLADYAFEKRTVLVVGSEREGLSDECLTLLDAVVEIPVWGLPYSYPVATVRDDLHCRQ